MEMQPHWGVGDLSASLHPCLSKCLCNDLVPVTFYRPLISVNLRGKIKGRTSTQANFYVSSFERHRD